MRFFKDGDELVLEPWRAAAFPVLKDLVVDRSAFDRIIQAGGYISVDTGGAPEANAAPVSKDRRRSGHGRRRLHRLRRLRGGLPERARRCCSRRPRWPISASLPQGQPERYRRVRSMVAQQDAEGFGHCTNHGECEAVCPKEIGLQFIAQLNRDLARAAPA